MASCQYTYLRLLFISMRHSRSVIHCYLTDIKPRQSNIRDHNERIGQSIITEDHPIHPCSPRNQRSPHYCKIKKNPLHPPSQQLLCNKRRIGLNQTTNTNRRTRIPDSIPLIPRRTRPEEQRIQRRNGLVDRLSHTTCGARPAVVDQSCGYS